MDYSQFKDYRAVNKYFRSIDESHLWPVCNNYNVTERAIRQLADYRAMGYTPEEYALTLGAQISEIVNDSNNW